MKKKIWRLFYLFMIVIATGAAIWVFDKKDWGICEAIAGGCITLIIERIWFAFQDLTDTTNWKTSQRMLIRGGYIKNETIIRISFAYLYRLKVANKYLLVKNSRNTGKYQPVGGVYQLTENEKLYLKNRFQVKDDDKILIDESSKNDYRLRMENTYLRSFMRRFNGRAERETINDISREFKEELVDAGILNWTQIKYRFCGRYMTELRYEEHFQIFELQLSDVVELIPSIEQERDLLNLMRMSSEKYKFATASEIASLGIDTTSGNLVESIGDHTKRILEETENELLKIKDTGKVFSVSL